MKIVKVKVMNKQISNFTNSSSKLNKDRPSSEFASNAKRKVA